LFPRLVRDLGLILALSVSAPAALLTDATAQTSQPSSGHSGWTVSDIFGAGAVHGAPAPSDSSWSPDGSRYTYRSAAEGLVSVDAKTGSRTVLVPEAKLKQVSHREVNEKDKDHRNRYSQPGYLWSPGAKQLLFDMDGTLWLDTLADGSLRQVGDSGQGSGDDAKFSPDGKAISYLHAHNLYVIEPGHGEPVALTHTTDAALLNGEVDWVYLEELKVRTNYAWAPDSGHVAYVQMNETKVPEYPLVDWIPTHATLDMQRYPQPGDANPVVRLGVVGATGGETKWIDLPIRAGDDYIPRLGWIDAHTVWAETLKRDHQHRDLYFADIATGAVKHVFAETDAKFFNDAYDVHFYAPGAFLLSSWRDGHTHLYRYSYDPAHPLGAEARLEGELERGDYEVGDVLSVDTAGKTVYYASTETAGGVGDAREQQVWAVGLDGAGKHPVTTAPGSHKAAFAEGHASYTDTASSSTQPPTLSLCVPGAACRQIWQQTVAPGHVANPAIMLELKAADGVTTLYAALTLPRGVTDAASVPLINNPYGGPGTATVVNRWGGPTHEFDELLAEHGFAVLHVDNRGMGQRGRAFEQASYHDFGAVQLADQLAAIDQVLARYAQLDKRRLGWWGWSWGGTFTLNALTHSDRFRAGVSVAPVTDMRNYDSIYTERYLGLPAENAAVYDAAAVLPTANRLKAHLLLVHGTGDDNVHMENTIQFVQKLIDADIPYDLQLYPRKTHSIAGPEARTHLYSRIVTHFELYLRDAPIAMTGLQNPPPIKTP
jgi:dipeptidyl-peptidase-4